jgi:hypothetical protein
MPFTLKSSHQGQYHTQVLLTDAILKRVCSSIKAGSGLSKVGRAPLDLRRADMPVVNGALIKQAVASSLCPAVSDRSDTRQMMR